MVFPNIKNRLRTAVRQPNATTALHTSIRTATGPHKMRSHLLGVATLPRADKEQTPTTAQMASLENSNQSGCRIPARTNITQAIPRITPICTTARTLNNGGNLPGHLPPIARCPQGAPTARQIWKHTTTHARKANTYAATITN